MYLIFMNPTTKRNETQKNLQIHLLKSGAKYLI